MRKNALKRFERANSLMSGIKIANVFCGKRSPEVVNTMIGFLLYHQVEMIWHQTVRKQFYLAKIILQNLRRRNFLLLRGYSPQAPSLKDYPI